jgi:putative hydrolase of HD superfamily
MDIKKVVNFIFELNQLKRQPHIGFQLAGVENPDSVAEHAFRAAQIGYVLAVMEGDVDAEKVVTMLVIHDNGEARVGDQHKLAARYVTKKEGEAQAFQDQLSGLGEQLGGKWDKYIFEYSERNTKEGIIAKDADWLETAFQAKEYADLGYSAAQDWIDNVEKALETGSAKQVLARMKETHFTDWWQGLKKMTYTKLDKQD